MNHITDSSNPALRHRIPLYPIQFLGAMVMVSLGPLLDPMMRELGVPLSQGGLINGGFFIGSALGVVVMNVAMSHVPAKWVFSGGTALLGLGLVVGGAAARDLWSLFFAYLVMGLAFTATNTACWMWLSAHAKKNTAASALAMILFFGLGMVVVPLVLGQAIESGATWRWILVAEGGIALLSALIFACLPVLDVPDRPSVRLSHLKTALKTNPRLLLGILGAGFMYTGAETTVNVWLPKFHIEVFSSTDARASLAVTLFWIGLVAGRLGFMPLTRRFSPARLLVLCGSVLAVFVVAMAFAPSQTVALALAMGAGLGASASYGLIWSYSGRFPEWQSGLVSSLFILAGAIGSVVFPYLTGPLAGAAGFRVALAFTAVPAFACALFALLIHRRADDGHS